MNAQGVAARMPVPAQPNRVDLRAVLDQKTRGFVRPPIKEGACGHVCESGDQEFARILPYPPPGKSLGAKTNHLPNIQGLSPGADPMEWGWNRKFGLKSNPVSGFKERINIHSFNRPRIRVSSGHISGLETAHLMADSARSDVPHEIR